MCDMTHSYVWHDLFTCVTWLIHMCDMTQSYVWHDSIHSCHMTHCIHVTWLILKYVTKIELCRLSFETWLHLCHTHCTWHNSIHPRHVTHAEACDQNRTVTPFFLDMTHLLHLLHVINFPMYSCLTSFMSHDPFWNMQNVTNPNRQRHHSEWHGASSRILQKVSLFFWNAYIHTYIQTYVHIYVRTYIHTYIHTYAHT